MPFEDVLQILKKENILIALDQIRLVMREAALQGVLVEVRLDRDQRVFSAALLAVTWDGSGTDSDCLLITPLEPPAGNLVIRQSQQIKIKCWLDLYGVESSVTFGGVETVNHSQVLRLAFPRVLRVAPRREERRQSVPKSRSCALFVSRRKESSVPGALLDVNMTGMGFTCQAVAEPPFEKGEVLRVQLLTSALGLPDFEMMGEVCYHARVREVEDPTRPTERYGLRFTTDLGYVQLKKLIVRLRQLDG